MRRLLLILIVLITSNLTSLAQIPGFPEDGIADRIGFWEKVFTIYGEEDLIIHDTERVDLIYDVVGERSRRTGVQRVRNLLDEVRRNISTPDRLSTDARRLYDLIEADGVRMAAGDIAVLRGRVHVQRGIKERFRSGIIKSGRYLAYFEEVLESEGVPRVVALLPLVESSFENEARSHAGAAGIWQFTRSTGQLYMRVTRGRDDRLNPTIATRSAGRLLKGNYDRLRSWAAGDHGLQPWPGRNDARQERPWLGHDDDHQELPESNLRIRFEELLRRVRGCGERVQQLRTVLWSAGFGPATRLQHTGRTCRQPVTTQSEQRRDLSRPSRRHAWGHRGTLWYDDHPHHGSERLTDRFDIRW